MHSYVYHQQQVSVRRLRIFVIQKRTNKMSVTNGKIYLSALLRYRKRQFSLSLYFDNPNVTFTRPLMTSRREVDVLSFFLIILLGSTAVHILIAYFCTIYYGLHTPTPKFKMS